MNGTAVSTEETAHRMSVLLLDDDRFTLEVVSEMLRGLGVTDIRTETDGYQALETLRNHPVDILICDLNMPHMDGIEFLRHMAEIRFGGGIILASGVGSGVLQASKTLVTTQGLNLLYLLKKPLRKDTLATALARFNEIRPGRRQVFPSAVMLSPDEVREGLANDAVEVFVQPKVSLRGRRVVGAECLARWRHPRRGLLGPETFIPVVEAHGMIDAFTLAVFRKAVAMMATWQSAGHSFKMAVNLSMDNMNMLDLPDIFERMLQAYDISPGNIVLEITETRLLEDLKVTLEVITRLRLKGFGLSIDDFGTGYSSMENLKRMPFSELKIDRAFVSGADQDAKARAILESSVSLGRNFNLNMVAEGVETQADWDLVSYCGCHEAQGYFIARPMPMSEFLGWVERWNDDVQR